MENTKKLFIYFYLFYMYFYVICILLYYWVYIKQLRVKKQLFKTVMFWYVS